MKWTKIIIYNIVIAGTLFLLVDFLYTQINPLMAEHKVYHPNFSYTFKPSYNDISAPEGITLCTDKNGFKTHCDNINRSSLSFDVAFIGDSFTQGVYLIYEDTFVGMYDLTHPNMRVANLGVEGYSPTRYLQKISYYLDKGLETDHVVVFVDYNDFRDEALIGNKFYDFIWRNFTSIFYVKNQIHENTCRHATQYLPECAYASRSLYGYEKRLYKEGQHLYKEERQYFKSSGMIERSLSKMEELYKLLNKHGIKLSVAVYPWPKQLRYDSAKNFYVKTWEKFCEQKCFAFINTFPTFFHFKEKLGFEQTRNKYYKSGDFHFSRAANKVIFEVLNKEFKVNEMKSPVTAK